MFLAPAVPSVAQWVQYVGLRHAVHQAVWHAQENVRITFSFFAFLFRSHTSRSSGCPDAQGDCCPGGGCCPGGQVSACTLLTI